MPGQRSEQAEIPTSQTAVAFDECASKTCQPDEDIPEPPPQIGGKFVDESYDFRCPW